MGHREWENYAPKTTRLITVLHDNCADRENVIRTKVRGTMVRAQPLDLRFEKNERQRKKKKLEEKKKSCFVPIIQLRLGRIFFDLCFTFFLSVQFHFLSKDCELNWLQIIAASELKCIFFSFSHRIFLAIHTIYFKRSVSLFC